MKPTIPYEPISHRYKALFGERVLKIPVTIAGDCPNRRGLKGMQTCIFCDEWGSAAFPEQRDLPLEEQIQSRLSIFRRRTGTQTFLVYFQAYTSTFLAVRKLQEHIETALRIPQVKGFVIGTRPDCVPPALIKLCDVYRRRCHVSVELGVQSFLDSDLEYLKRGHTAQCARTCIEEFKRQTPTDLGIHLIFGLPGETDAKILQTAKQVAALPLDHVKLHNLHVLKGTPLEKAYRAGEFTPIEIPEYARRVSLFLRHIPRRIAVHRLAAVSSRWDELVAPDWTRHRMFSHQFIVDWMNERGQSQGDLL